MVPGREASRKDSLIFQVSAGQVLRAFLRGSRPPRRGGGGPRAQIIPGTTSEPGAHRGDQIPPSFIKIHCNPVAILAQVILTEAIFAQAGAPEAQ